MKKLLIQTAAIIAAIGAVNAADAKKTEETGYTLWVANENGYSTIAVSEDRKNGAFTIAAGEDDLDVLSGKPAKAAFRTLNKRNSRDRVKTHEEHGHEKHGGGNSHQRNITIIKSNSTDGENIQSVRIMQTRDDESDREIAIELDNVDTDTDGIGENTVVRFESGKVIVIAGGEETVIADLPHEGDLNAEVKSKIAIKTRGGGDESSFVRISGADAKSAAAFIDGADGLDNSEKGAMKAALKL